LPLIRAELKYDQLLRRHPKLHDKSQVLYLPFDKDDGSIARDRSGYNNHGTIYGATRTSGKIGNALSFDGVDDYVDIPDRPSLRWDLNPFTIMFWLKETTARAQEVMCNKGVVQTGYWRIDFFDSTGPIAFGTRSSDTNELLEFDAGVRPVGWTHVAFTREDPIWKVYLNGSLRNTVKDTRSGRGMTFAGISIGKKLWLNYFNGLIDEVRIYNRALSQAEIQRVMNMRGI